MQVAERYDDGYGYSLYLLNDYYVEVCYNRVLNKLISFTSISTYNKLEPYLDRIDISRNNDAGTLVRLYKVPYEL